MKWSEEELIIRIMDARDGKLDERQLAELQSFIEENAEFKDYLEVLPFIESENQQFDKETLYKAPFQNIEAYKELQEPIDDKLIIGEIEGVLTTEERDFMRFKQNEHAFLRELGFYQATKLIPDSTIQYIQKEKLKRKTLLIALNRPLLVGLAAASVAILLYFSISAPENQLNTHVSQTRSQSALKVVKSSKKAVLTVGSTKVVEPSNTLPLEKKKIKNADSPIQIVEESQEAFKTPVIPMVEAPEQVEQEFAVIFPESEDQRAIENQKLPGTKQYDNLRAYVKGKFRKTFFGEELITRDAQASEISRKVSEQTGLDLAYNRTKSTDQEELYFKLGAFSLERKRSN